MIRRDEFIQNSPGLNTPVLALHAEMPFFGCKQHKPPHALFMCMHFSNVDGLIPFPGAGTFFAAVQQ
jgi:hypothetical protein